jgi:hypothetical protein
MSNGDFEVMPRGTTSELMFLRQLAKDIVDCYPKHGVHFTTEEVKRLAAKVEGFYEHHNEMYPVTV